MNETVCTYFFFGNFYIQQVFFFAFFSTDISFIISLRTSVMGSPSIRMIFGPPVFALPPPNLEVIVSNAGKPFPANTKVSPSPALASV